VLDDVAVRRLRHERRDAEKHLVENDAEAVEIGAAVELTRRGGALAGLSLMRSAWRGTGVAFRSASIRTTLMCRIAGGCRGTAGAISTSVERSSARIMIVWRLDDPF
jgi:hypothetical protein